MVVRIAINGFGRIGRLVFRAIRELYPKECHVVAIHDLCDIGTNVHLLNYDSAHQKFPEQLTVTDENTFEVGTGPDKWIVKNLDGRDQPHQLPWGDLDVDVVVEASGIYRTRCVKGSEGQIETDGYDGHLIAGAKKVLLTVPACDDIECTLVLGVNDEDLKPNTKCIANASCTTNCLAPIIKVLNDKVGIKNGYSTSVHAYTSDQVVSDIMHKDLRRARAAAQNIIPTTTGATYALSKVVKNLTRGCMDSLALRVPAVTGSLVDITVNVRENVSKEQINTLLRDASLHEYRGIIGFTDDPVVSADIIGDRHSAIVDALSTMVLPNEKGGSLVKVLAWYDNEWMYSCRCADILVQLGKYI